MIMNEETKKVMDIIKSMDEKDKLRLAICLNDSVYSNISYDKKELVKKFDRRLEEIDEQYKNNIVNFSKYKNVMLTMAMISELDKEEQNKVALFLFNDIHN